MDKHEHELERRVRQLEVDFGLLTTTVGMLVLAVEELVKRTETPVVKTLGLHLGEPVDKPAPHIIRPEGIDGMAYAPGERD